MDRVGANDRGLISRRDGPSHIYTPHGIPLSSGVRFCYIVASHRSVAPTANTATARTLAISRAATAFSDSPTDSQPLASFTDSSSETEAYSSSRATRIQKHASLTIGEITKSSSRDP